MLTLFSQKLRNKQQKNVFECMKGQVLINKLPENEMKREKNEEKFILS
jgi:hypothetical protein